MTLTRRLDIEQQLLRKHFGPTFRFQGKPGQDDWGAIGRLRTNSANEYVVFVELQGFPDSPPAAWVVDPILSRPSGQHLPAGSHSMHTRGVTDHGHVEVCHYADCNWEPSVTLYKVVLKVRIWLEAYEAYLRTGKKIDQYLAAM